MVVRRAAGGLRAGRDPPAFPSIISDDLTGPDLPQARTSVRETTASSAADLLTIISSHAGFPSCGIITLNLLQASHAHERWVRQPQTRGPSPQLRPRARLRDPRSMDAMSSPPMLFAHSCDGATNGPFRAGEAEGFELVEHDMGTDLAVGALHPLLDLEQELISDAVPSACLSIGKPIGIALCDPGCDTVVGTADELRFVAEAARQIEGFEYLHDLLAGPQTSLRVGGLVGNHQSIRDGHPSGGFDGHGCQRGQIGLRLRAVPLAASGQLHDRLRAGFHGRRQAGSEAACMQRSGKVGSARALT